MINEPDRHEQEFRVQALARQLHAYTAPEVLQPLLGNPPALEALHDRLQDRLGELMAAHFDLFQMVHPDECRLMNVRMNDCAAALQGTAWDALQAEAMVADIGQMSLSAGHSVQNLLSLVWQIRRYAKQIAGSLEVRLND